MASLDNLIASGAVFLESVSVAAQADGDNLVIPGVVGKKVRVTSYLLATTAAGVIIVQDTASNEKARIRSGGDGGGASFSGDFAFESAEGEGIEVVNPAGVDTYGHIGFVRL